MRRQHISEAEIHQREYGEIVLLCGNTPGMMRTVKGDLKHLRIAPGRATSYHRHLVAESIFHVLEGEVRIFVGDATALGHPGDTIIVPAGETHRLENPGPGTAVILEVEAPAHDRADKFVVGRTPAAANVRQAGRFWEAARGEVKVKVCGVKNLETALACNDAGVDAIGIHAVPGLESVARLAEWRCWLRALPPGIDVFLLTETTDPIVLGRLADYACCSTVQLQGRHDPAEVREVAGFLRPTGCKLVKSLGREDLSEREAIAYAGTMAGAVDALLLDTSFGGGSGKVHDWQTSRRIAERCPLPIILAGGLTPASVAEAIRTVRPFAVDVESGVETQIPLPGSGRLTAKSFKEIDAFLRAARGGAETT